MLARLLHEAKYSSSFTHFFFTAAIIYVRTREVFVTVWLLSELHIIFELQGTFKLQKMMKPIVIESGMPYKTADAQQEKCLLLLVTAGGYSPFSFWETIYVYLHTHIYTPSSGLVKQQTKIILECGTKI